MHTHCWIITDAKLKHGAQTDVRTYILCVSTVVYHQFRFAPTTVGSTARFVVVSSWIKSEIKKSQNKMWEGNHQQLPPFFIFYFGAGTFLSADGFFVHLRSTCIAEATTVTQ